MGITQKKESTFSIREESESHKDLRKKQLLEAAGTAANKQDTRASI